MTQPAIKIRQLSKQYFISGATEEYQTFQDSIMNAVLNPFRRINGLLKGKMTAAAELHKEFWALQDISLDIQPGEIVGIVGHNGAGKSTLLKILSRITEPTSGFVEIKGRVGTLLEVGTGFHHELTGRENIYLNGSILGMSRYEINRKFDEIVDFSEVEKFIDTPVKHYSSGMKVRLAFAVAAHLEPEILIVDEVLAVGDVAFQKKCLGKIGSVAKDGRTILLVSHNMLAIQSMCTRGVLLHQGQVAFDGNTNQAVSQYLSAMDQLRTVDLDARQDREGGDVFRFLNIEFLHPETNESWKALQSGQPVMIRFKYHCRSPKVMTGVKFSITFFTQSGAHLFGCNSAAVGVTLDIHPGDGFTDCILDRFPLKAGQYTYDLNAERGEIRMDWLKDAGMIDVEVSDFYGTGVLPSNGQPGVLVDYSWKVDQKTIFVN